MRRVVMESMEAGEVVAVLEHEGDELWLINRQATLEEFVEHANRLLVHIESHPQRAPGRLPAPRRPGDDQQVRHESWRGRTPGLKPCLLLAPVCPSLFFLALLLK